MSTQAGGTPFFSVVIPTYNRAKLVRTTLDSVCAQRGDDFEVIVVDDGSTDGTLEVVKEYADRVQVISQANAGPGAARATGAQQARGQYVAFLDSDDIWFSWSLETYRRAIAENGGPAVILGTPALFAEEPELKTVEVTAYRAEKHADYFSTHRQFIWFSGSSIVVRRDVLERGGGVTRARINADDLDLLLRVGDAPGLVHVRSPETVAYRQHPGNIMTNTVWCFESLRHLIEREKQGKYPGGTARKWERRKIIAFNARATSVRCVLRKRADLGWRLYGQMLGWSLRMLRWKYLLGFAFARLRFKSIPREGR